MEQGEETLSCRAFIFLHIQVHTRYIIKMHFVHFIYIFLREHFLMSLKKSPCNVTKLSKDYALDFK